MSVEVDVPVWPQIVLGPGGSGCFEHWWRFDNGTSVFDSDHWYWFSTTPDSDQSTIQVTSQWSSKDLDGQVHYFACWQNLDQNTSVAFRPKAIQAPSKF
jgi:hypothetical protein